MLVFDTYMKVLKFGGTSVGSASRIRDVAKLVSDSGKNIVVLSAMAGTTNTLLEICSSLYDRDTESARLVIESLREKYVSVVEELFSTEASKAVASEYISEAFQYLLSFLKAPFRDTQERIVVSQGELLSTFLFATYLKEQGVNVCLLPALTFMHLDSRGEPDIERLREELTRLLEEHSDAELYLTQGFICTNVRGEVDNLKRGGSDYTACLIGAALKTEEIQIWTDIDGLHNNDPRVVNDTTPVRHLHFDEAAELAFFGAKILHPTCILPARYVNVPVRVLNTMDPTAPGTLIDNDFDKGRIKAVAAKDNIVAIKIKSSRMLLAPGFLRKVFETFESYRTSVDMVCTSEVGVSLTIDDTRYLNDIVHDLKRYGTVSVELDMCIICVVGDMHWSNRGFESQVMTALTDIAVRMVSYGGSNYNISVLVREEDKASALRALSSKLFKQ